MVGTPTRSMGDRGRPDRTVVRAPDVGCEVGMNSGADTKKPDGSRIWLPSGRRWLPAQSRGARRAVLPGFGPPGLRAPAWAALRGGAV